MRANPTRFHSMALRRPLARSTRPGDFRHTKTVLFRPENEAPKSCSETQSFQDSADA